MWKETNKYIYSGDLNSELVWYSGHEHVWSSNVEVCIPEIVLNESRQDWRAIPVGGTGTRLILYYPVAQEHPWNKQDRTTRYHSGKSWVVLNFKTFPGKPLYSDVHYSHPYCILQWTINYFLCFISETKFHVLPTQTS